eukprot:RCo009600
MSSDGSEQVPSCGAPFMPTSMECFLSRGMVFHGRTIDIVTCLRRVVVWGGGVLNCGESALTEMLSAISDQLELFIYFPAVTKGGLMARPRYFQGDREGQQAFPRLRCVAVPLRALLYGSLDAWGYFPTPALRELFVLTDPPQVASTNDRVVTHAL